ncbi:MAG: carbohydrate binding domain-containing protein, partial [Patescibacteria group bacterium]
GSGSTGCSVTNATGAFACSDNITTTATVQGGTVNATTALQLGGADINTAGTLTNVAYLNQGNTFTTGTNTFSAAGTALAVTNNATIGGTLNGQTISSSSNFTGTATIQGASALTLGLTGTNTGSILFKGATGASGTLTVIAPTNPSNNTLTLPNETGTICSTGSVCTGYAPVSPSGSYVQLQATTPGSAQTGNLNLSGTGIFGTSLEVGTASAFQVSSAGAVTAVGVNSGAGLLQGALGITVTGAAANINASSNFDTNINTGTSTGAVNIGNSAAGAISLQGGSSINLTAGTASTISTLVGNLTLQGGSGAVSLGTSTALNNSTGGLSVAAGGVGQNLNLDAATTGVINIGNTSTGNILLGGGSASTGCTVTNSTGDFACAGNINSVGGAFQIGGTDINIGGTLSNVAYLDTAQTFTQDNLFQSSGDSPTAFQVQNSLGSSILNVDASTLSVRIGSIGTPTGQLYVGGSAPVSPIGSASVGSSPYVMAIQGRYAYVTYTSGTDSLQIFDISDPLSPVEMSNIATGETPRGLAVQGRYAYVANNSSNTVQIFDISNPTTPVLTGSIGAGNSPDSIAVQGRYAYVASYSGGTVNVYDISNPASPVLTGSVAVSGAYQIIAQGRYAYLTTWSGNSLVILNILNPASPTVISNTSIGSGTYPTSVYVQDKYAYITKWLVDEIEIYDISDPVTPVLVGAQTTVDEPYSIYVQGRTAYVSGDGFIETFDVSNPTIPGSNGTFAGGGYPSTAIAQGRNLYVLSGNAIDVFDIGGAYVQQLETGGIQTSTLTTSNNANIGGTLSIQGGLTVFDSSQFSGSLGLSGTFKSSVNSSTAFQVQNANSVNLLSADTSVNPNLVTNPSFEIGTTGWLARTTATLTQSTAQQYVNAASLSVATGAAANNGTKYNYALATGTQYSLSFYAKLSSGTFTTMQAGRTDNGTTGGETNCLTGQTVSTTQWTRFTCTFTTGTTSGTPYIYIKQSDGVARTFFIDGVQLELAAASTIYKPGTLAIDAVVNSHMTFQNSTDATNAFQIQNSAGTSNLLVADTINNRLAVGQATAGYALDVNGSINVTTGNSYKINGVDICTSSGCTVLASSGIRNQTTSQTSANFNIQSTADASITGVLMSRASQTADLLQSQNSSGTKLSGISADGSLTANAQATGTTATTSGTGTNTTTVTLTGSAFADGDVILIANAGQDYYTRITAGGGTASLTVSPAVSFDNGVTVTKYTIQNIGATTADYTTQSNRFFQGYFLGGVVAGAGTTTLSDSRLSSTTAMNFNSPSYIFQPTGDSATVFQVLNNAGTQLFNVDSLANAISIGNTQTNGSISLGAAMTTGTINIGGTGAQTGNIGVGTGTGVQSLNFGTGGTGAKTVTIGSTASSGQTMLQSGTNGTLVKGATSTTAFQVQNANSDQLFNVDTTATQNLLTNSNFETNITGWSAKGSAATPAFDITQRYIGIGSLKEVTTAAADDGVKYDYALASTTTYGFSFYAKLDSASAAFATMKVGYSNDGSTDTDCLTAQTVTKGGWTRFSCLFTTATTSGTPYVYIKQSDATIHTYYIDGAQLQTSSVTSYKLGQAQINGIITSPVNIQNQSNSTTALTIQNASGEQLFGVDTSTTANLLSNSSIESDLTGWSPKGIFTTNTDFETSTTGWSKMGTNDAITRTTGEFYNAAAALQVDTSATDAAGADGAKFTFSLLSSTTYTFSVYAKASGSSFSTFELGRSENGSTNTSCLTAQTVSSSGWANYTCTFTTGTTSGTRYMYVRQTDQATRTFYIDSVSLTDSVLSRSTAQRYSGDSSMRIVTTATLSDGVKYNHALASNTTYTYSFYSNLASGSFRSLQFGRSDDGTPESEKTCISSQTVTIGVWTRYSCTFTTGTVAGSPYLFIKQATLTTTQDYYVDAVQLEAASSTNLASNGDIEVNADGWVPANYITNGEFESDIIDTIPAGWSGLGAAITKVVTEHNLGLGSTKVVTTAAADDGARTTTLSTGLTANKTYTFTVYAKAASGSFSTFELGRSEDAGSTDTSCLTGQSVTTAWAMYTCTFTTGGSVTGGSYVYVKQTDATARTFYIDSASLTTATVARTTGEFNTGAASLQVDTVALAQDGVRYKYGLQANTNYTVVAYAKLSSGTFTALQIGRSDTGLTDTSCLTSQTVTTSGWTRYECNFTAGSTVNTDTSYIYFKQTSATGAPRTFYVDSVSVISSSPPLPYQQGRVSIAGVVSSPVSFQASSNSSTAFQVLNATGGSLLTIDSTTANTVINGSNVAETQAWPSTTANGSNGGTFANAGMVAANGYMYVVGGYEPVNLGTGTNTVSYAKIKTNGTLGNWTVTSPMPVILHQHTTVISNGYIYAIGGLDDSVGYSDAVYYAKLNSDGTVGTWRSTTPINNSATTRSEHASIVVNGYLYVIGGVDNVSAATNDIYYTKLNADGSVGAWITARDLPLALSSMAASVANGYVYITGGNDSGFAPVNTTYFAKLSSDGTIGTWNTANALPAVVADHQTVVLNGYIYSIGGYGTSNVDTSSVYYAKLNPNGSIGSWVTNANSLTTANSSFGAATTNGYIYVGGGWNNTGYYIGTGTAAISYTSTARTQIAGSLDLVGTSGQTLSDSGTGGSLTAGNTTIVGTLDVIDQAHFMQGVSVNGTLTAQGDTTIKSATNSTAAFQIQNADGASLVSVDTATTPNLISNSSFESDASGWSDTWTNYSTRSKTTNQHYVGKASLQAITPANASAGVMYSYSLSASTQYTLSFYAKAGSSFTTMNVGRGELGDASQTNCLTGQTVSTTVWTRYTCTFTTGATVASFGTPYIYIIQSDSTPRTFYIDGVQLEAAAAATNFKLGTVALDGIINSHAIFQNSVDSTTAFQIQNAAGTDIVNVDSLNSQLNVTGANSAATLGSELAGGVACSGTNWTGTGPWTHTVGSTANLSCTPPASVTAGATYQVVFTVGGSPTAGETITPSLGGVSGLAIGGNSTTQTQLITTSGTANLTFIPTSNFNGTISSVSVKLIALSNSVLSVKNSDNSVGLEIRAGGSGLNNTFIGLSSGKANTTGNSNTSIGAYALQSTTTGLWNTAIGKDSLRSNTAGNYNTAIGKDSLQVNTTGSSNTAIGASALQANTTGYENAAIGTAALVRNTTGYGNTTIGDNSLAFNTTGNHNTATGQYALLGNTTGNGNTSQGYQSLGGNTTGSFNTALGYNAGYTDGGFATLSNLQEAAAIGAYSQVQQSNSLVLGRTATGSNQTSIGIGTTAPTNLFSVSPIYYNTGTASQSGTTITGAGTTWTSDMVGMEFIFADGTKRTITAFGSTTSLTAGTSGTVSSQAYRIHNPAFYVSSTGTAALRSSTNSTTAFQIQNAAGTTLLNANTTGQEISITSAVLKINGIAAPTGATLTSFSTGGTLAADTYYYRISAYNASGRTQAVDSTPASVTTTGSTSLNTLSWSAVTGATGYWVHRSDDGGATYHAIDVGNVLAGVDDGSNPWSGPDSSIDAYKNSTADIYLRQGGSLKLDMSGNASINETPEGDVEIANLNGGAYSFITADNFGIRDTAYYHTSLGINANGEAIFQNNANSTTAFQIQKAGGTPMLVADTTNDRLYVGNPTADSTGTILVLDTKNTSGDPTGVDGAMYYNSDSKSFRCYSNGAWRGCMSGVVFANTSVPGGNTFNNTTSETNFSSNYSIPANDCQPGRVYKITAQGVFSTHTSGGQSLRFKVKLGTTALGDTGANGVVNSVSSQAWRIEYAFICQTAGGSGTVEGQGILSGFDSPASGVIWSLASTSSTTIDTTTSQTLQISGQFNNAETLNSVTLRQFIVEASGP